MTFIEKEHVKAEFSAYTAPYDIKDEKIALKIEHTYRVADLCEVIARNEGLTELDANLAWLIGMLHDIGRFEQVRQYGTFSDADSVDHAELGADILFDEKKGIIRDFVRADIDDDVIEAAIRNHSRYRIDEKLEERQKLFARILRDADKIDILKVNVDFPLEAIYNTTKEIIRRADVTPEVMDSFYEHHATLRKLKKTPVDHVVGHISLVFELEFEISLQIVMKQGYLDRLLDFESDNPSTRKCFARLNEEMNSFLAMHGIFRH